jgi:hypothetical protein
VDELARMRAIREWQAEGDRLRGALCDLAETVISVTGHAPPPRLRLADIPPPRPRRRVSSLVLAAAMAGFLLIAGCVLALGVHGHPARARMLHSLDADWSADINPGQAAGGPPAVQASNKRGRGSSRRPAHERTGSIRADGTVPGPGGATPLA